MKRKKAFTLIELLVVISVIALLLSILLPSLSSVKAKAMQLLSITNMKSLTLAWTAYATENGGKLLSAQVWPVYSKATNQPGQPVNGIHQHDWVHPYISAIDPLFTAGMTDHARELAGIQKGALWPYVGDEEVYHSPGDRNWKSGIASYSAATSPYRSYAISDAMNGQWMPDYSYTTSGEIINPSVRMVFTEEEDNNGANWGSWILNTPGSHSWWDPLAAWYDQGTSSVFGFADGHAEKHLWQNQSTKNMIKTQKMGHIPPLNERDDILYIESIYHHKY